ncbi:MAG: T9SS type A sorting domain-containing protein [Bacteroidales bacterium]|nr:T9SS type A sorting domain-containing protein [Bacteroidales bacterium]
MQTIKIIFFLLCLSGGIRAQDYQMFSGDRISFFEYPDGEIISVRFDSVHDNDAVELYPPPNIQIAFETGCATPYGTSWLGEKIIIRPDGTHLFISESSDTTRIRSQALPGVPWIAFRNSAYVISATVLSMEEASFLGITDTVKNIGFQAYDPEMNELEHFINDRVISISKNHGATRLVGFSNFPEQSGFHPLNFYYAANPELSLVGITAEDLSAGIQNLTWFEVFDFSPGDEIHIMNDQVDIDVSYNYSKIRKTIKKYLDRKKFQDSIVYRVEVTWKEKREASGEITYFHDTITEVIYRNDAFDRLPGEPVIESYRAYTHLMYKAEPLAKVDPGGGLDIWPTGTDTCWSFCCVDGCLMERRYVKGLGGPYGSCSNAFSFGGTDLYYVYYRKGATTWGAPIDFTAIEEQSYEDEINVFPNPSDGFVQIFAPGREISAVTVLNLCGEIMMEKQVRANEGSLDLTAFPPGIYLLNIHSGDQRYFTRIIKQ